MINVIVVDDEVINRVGISNMLNWENEGYCLLGSFENGMQAYECIKSKHVDIVITDIRMPALDGLELMQKAKNDGFTCEFIVMSVIDEFSYVQQALKLGAADYILKMELTKEIIVESLKRVSQKIVRFDEEQTVSTDSNKALKIKRAIIKELLFGHIDISADIICQMKHYDIDLETIQHFCVVLFKMESPENNMDYLQMIDEALSDADSASCAIWTSFDEISIILSLNEKNDKMKLAEIKRWVNRIIFMMKQYFNRSGAVFVSATHNKIDELPLAYLQAFQIKNIQNSVLNNSLVIYDDVVKSRDFTDFESFENIISKFSLALDTENLENLKSFLQELIDTIMRSKYLDLNYVKYFTSTLVAKINFFLNKKQVLPEAFWGNGVSQYQQLYSMNQKASFINYLKDLQEKMDNVLSEEQGNYLIKQTKNYIKLHYTENINLLLLAKQSGVTGNYLSMLFKKVTGETLKDYCIRLRIEKAKKLLRETTIPICEITQLIGYDNEQYFSRIFRQKTGTSPSQYRNRKTI